MKYQDSQHSSSLLILRCLELCKSKSFSSIFEFLLAQVLCEDISELLISRNIVKLDFSKLYGFSYEMFRHPDMFSLVLLEQDLKQGI
jgi:hypothetical protein